MFSSVVNHPKLLSNLDIPPGDLDAMYSDHCNNTRRVIQALGCTTKELCQDSNISDQAIAKFINDFTYWQRPDCFVGHPKGDPRTIPVSNFAKSYKLGGLVTPEIVNGTLQCITEEEHARLKLWLEELATHRAFKQLWKEDIEKKTHANIFMAMLHDRMADLGLAVFIEKCESAAKEKQLIERGDTTSTSPVKQSNTTDV
ncbi:hypothetical protein MMC14_006841 [Varicellaria rhodocarpa]|nr:hypothetical protein [Varicellaria rhodocarpa]